MCYCSCPSCEGWLIKEGSVRTPEHHWTLTTIIHTTNLRTRATVVSQKTKTLLIIWIRYPRLPKPAWPYQIDTPWNRRAFGNVTEQRVVHRLTLANFPICGNNVVSSDCDLYLKMFLNTCSAMRWASQSSARKWLTRKVRDDYHISPTTSDVAA